VKRDTFRDFVLDQLREIEDLEARAMFGGHGFYSGDRFFAIVFHGRLYLRTDAASRAEFERHGMGPFQPPTRRQTLGTYYEVPLRVLENGSELVAWARRAIAARASGGGAG
jgi:DNA transformation protein